MSYEVDLWGRVRRANQAAAARLEASQAAWHVARLALAADIANTYFALRTLEAEERLLRDAIDLRQRTAGLVAARKRGGLASDLDLARTATELAAAEAEVAVVLRTRADQEHALAILVGATPEDFVLGPAAATRERGLGPVSRGVAAALRRWAQSGEPPARGGGLSRERGALSRAPPGGLSRGRRPVEYAASSGTTAGRPGTCHGRRSASIPVGRDPASRWARDDARCDRRRAYPFVAGPRGCPASWSAVGGHRGPGSGARGWVDAGRAGRGPAATRFLIRWRAAGLPVAGCIRIPSADAFFVQSTVHCAAHPSAPRWPFSRFSRSPGVSETLSR